MFWPGLGTGKSAIKFNMGDKHGGVIVVSGANLLKINFKIDTKKSQRPYIPKTHVRKYDTQKQEAARTGHGGNALLNSQQLWKLTVEDSDKTVSWKKDDKGNVVDVTHPNNRGQSAITVPLRAIGYCCVGALYIKGDFYKIKNLVLYFIPRKSSHFKEAWQSKFKKEWSDELIENICVAASTFEQMLFSFVQQNRDYFYDSSTQKVKVHHADWASFATVDGMPIYDDCVQSDLAVSIGYADGKKYVLIYLYNLFYL